LNEYFPAEKNSLIRLANKRQNNINLKNHKSGSHNGKNKHIGSVAQ